MAPSLSHPFDDDKLKEECGIFGVIGVADAANFVALGAARAAAPRAGGGRDRQLPPRPRLQLGPPLRLCARQLHQGRRDGHPARQLGHRPCALFHRRVQGPTAIRDVQPFFGEFSMGGCAIAHNGNLTNAARCGAS
jgi:amidophosphoribosyltransferase